MTRSGIRPATLQDLGLLVLHRRRMWEDIGERDATALDEGDRVYRRWARQRMRTKRLIAFVAEDRNGRAVGSGCIWLRPMQPRPGYALRPIPYLLSMYTEPDHRGRGIATRLVREAIRWCRGHGYPRLVLHASTQGRSLYRNLGFERGWEMRIKLPAGGHSIAAKRKQPVTSS